MVVAGNPGAGGPFSPLVVAVRSVMGVKEFNQFRGKMISLHSQGEPSRALGPAGRPARGGGQVWVLQRGGSRGA